MLAMGGMDILASPTPDFGGVIVMGVLIGAFFGIPLALIRLAIAGRGKRVRTFWDTLLMAWIGATGFMFLIWVID
ncbi:MAG: hypothetical protein QM754_17920 [Tepidisphaeraceae bacterium]